MLPRLAIAALLLALAPATALADRPANEAELARVTEALAALGCTVGSKGVEVDDDGEFEIDDAACAAGTFDIELRADYSLDSMDRD